MIEVLLIVGCGGVIVLHLLLPLLPLKGGEQLGVVRQRLVLGIIL